MENSLYYGSEKKNTGAKRSEKKNTNPISHFASFRFEAKKILCEIGAP
jgi:preprotein translocase subunit SecE